MAIFLKNFKKRIMDSFFLAAQEPGAAFYIFLSKHTPFVDDAQPPAETESIEDSSINMKKEMMLGKKIAAADIAYMITRYDWTANTVYTMYDHRDDQLFDKQFYVLNNDFDVYKCLFNNNDQPSTVEPITVSNSAFTTGDGYVWKYMFSIDNANFLKFATNTLVPVSLNANVMSASETGAIDIITVDNGGQGYKTTSGTISSVVNTTVFQIETTNVSDNDFYKDNGIYITNGTGQGNLTIISEYTSNSSGRFVKTADQLTVDTTSDYLISPQIRINGNGSNCTAYSAVNATTGSIESIYVLNRGQDYSIASAEVIANTAYGSGAAATPIISPPGGHGSKPAQELGSEQVAIGVNIANTEGNTISTDITFRSAGLLADPRYASNGAIYTANTFSQLTEITYSTTAGTFIINEQIRGQSTNATAVVAFSNTSEVHVTSEIGLFSNSEIFIGNTSGTIGTITNINNPDIDRYSGEVFYYDNIQPVARSNTTIELVRLVVKF